MRYEDGRFARHPRFRYWALNTIFRQRAREASRWYAKSHPEDGALNIEEIREMIDGNNAAGLAQRVSRAAAPIEGSRPFWTSKRRDLNSQIRDLGCPSVFFTCSAADIQWPDLHRHMPGYTGDNEPDGPEAYRTRWAESLLYGSDLTSRRQEGKHKCVVECLLRASPEAHDHLALM
jgi:hypothetical protein